MHDALLLVEITDAVSNLHDHVARELFGKVGELDDLVEELAALHEPEGVSEAECRNDVLEGEEIVLAGLGKVEQAHDAGVGEATHDLDLLENVGALESGGQDGPRCVAWSAERTSVTRGFFSRFSPAPWCLPVRP